MIKKIINYRAVQLPERFRLSGHTMGFHPQTQKLEPPFTAYYKITKIVRAF